MSYASFSPDNRFVVTASQDNTARVWDSATGISITAPLEHSSAVRRAWFSPDARRLVTATVDGTAKVWDLSINQRPVEDLAATAVVLAGRQRGPDAGLQWTQRDALRSNFRNLRAKYPDQFTSAPNDVVSWHQSEAIDCQVQQQWSAAEWHLSRAIEIEPGSADNFASRARVAMKLEQWQPAAADLSTAVKLGLDDALLRAERGRCYVKAASELATIVSAGATWQWLHPADGTDPAIDDEDFHQTFFHTDYDDLQWKRSADRAGPVGGFGYGDPVGVDIGTPPPGLRKTAYFRHAFSTNATFYDLSLSLQRDDGVIVYLDGVEVGRDQSLVGPEAYELLSSLGRGDPSERILLRIPLSVILEPGEHVLAISLHNFTTDSSDLRIAEISLQGRRLNSQPPTLVDASELVDRGRAFAEFGLLHRSVHDFTSALQLSGAHEEALLGRARSYVKLNRWKNAAADYRRVSQTRPHDNALRQEVGEFHLQIRKEKMPIYAPALDRDN